MAVRILSSERLNDDVTPWIKAFVNARKWVEGKTAEVKAEKKARSIAGFLY